MDNNSIADHFSLLSKLMDIHGENSFRAKNYSIAAFTIEKLPAPLSQLPQEQIAGIKGIGDSTAAKIKELLNTGRLAVLDEIMLKTPPGIIEMMQIKGLGPKKISTIWKEMEIESIGELLYACNENRLTLFKGFGAKTQENVKQSIEFFLNHQGHFLYAQIAPVAEELHTALLQKFPDAQIAYTGQFRREAITIDKLEWVVTLQDAMLHEFLLHYNVEQQPADPGQKVYKTSGNVTLVFHLADSSTFARLLFETTATPSFLSGFPAITDQPYPSEEEIFTQASAPFVPAFLREEASIYEQIQSKGLPELITPEDIKGIIHSHSNWSDGSNTLEEMAEALIRDGKEYLVISDHSRTAAYANGLTIERVIAQHQQIEALNKKYAPFRIFKSIESDILNDGALDYPEEVLKTFDLVIASVHSNLKMPEEKAMARLLRAIENPYTRILGHPTGRLLLSRNGYPIDHKKIIEACVANNVVIEINAHPRRLDLDWQWIPYALEKGALLSINPDAHAISGFSDTRYGVLAARKGLLTKERNLSSFSLAEFEAFLSRK